MYQSLNELKTGAMNVRLQKEKSPLIYKIWPWHVFLNKESSGTILD